MSLLERLLESSSSSSNVGFEVFHIIGGKEMFMKNMKSKVVFGTATLLAFGICVPAVGALGASDDQVSGPNTIQATMPDPTPDISQPVTTNMDLVSNLDEEGSCLFDHDVYPAGGVGYRDSSLPYDDLEPIHRAEQTLRAQILRMYAGQVMDVTFTGSTGIVTLSDSSIHGAVPSVDDLVNGDREAMDALAALRAAGTDVAVVSRQAPSLLDVCKIRSVIRSVATEYPTLSAGVTINAAEGKVDITVNAELMLTLEAALLDFEPWIRVQSGEIEPTSRTNDSAPWYGGARLNLANGAPQCSTSFRFNNGQKYLLTADHCGPSGTTWWNNGTLYPSDYVGMSTSNLGAYKVDAAVITGSSYGSRVYIGPPSSSTSIEANSVYPNSTLLYGDKLLISGATSGQGTITATGLSPVCLFYNGKEYCHLLYFSAVGGLCVGGDSGGPIGVYDPANGRLIASAIVSATQGNRNTNHWCLGTDISVPIYLWGGGTIS